MNLFRLKMKSTISILLFFGLPFVIYGAKEPCEFKKEVEEMNVLAENGTKINNELLLKQNGFLCESGFGFIYEGTFIAENRSVAIKFVKNENIKSCEREFAKYSYLKAYKNESVEKYGISAVYYYGRWENYILMALTKFDTNLEDIAQGFSSFGQNNLDILILLRDFVFQSKYLHSHGVRHDDINPRSIMLRGHRSFLIDLHSSSKMLEDIRCVNYYYKCRRYNTGQKRRAIDDYESFIYTISAVTGRNWFGPGFNNKYRINLLSNYDGLEKIIKEFAEEVFIDDASKQFPNYNYLEMMISNEIEENRLHGPPKFSWVAPDAETTPERNIMDIVDPIDINFKKFVYPPKVGRLPKGQVTQTSMTPRKRSSKLFFGFYSKPQSN